MSTTETQFSDETENNIGKISEAYDVPEDDLRERLAELIDELDGRGFNNPERRAVRKLALEHKGGSMGTTERLRGVVLGAGDAADTTAKRVGEVKNYIRKRGPEEAAKQGFIKKASEPPEGLATVVVDGQPYYVLDSQSNSPTQGEVLPAQDYVRYIQGAVWRGDEGPYLFEGPINAEDPREVPEVPPKFVPLEFDARFREDEKTGEVRLYFDEGADFEVKEDADIPIERVFESIGLAPLSEVAEYSERPDYDRNELVATKGSVTYMDLAPDGDMSRRLTIVDPFDFENDPRVTVWLPDHVDIDFAEESEVFVLGNVTASKNDQYDDSVQARGVWADPEYRVDRAAVGSLGADEADDEPAPEPETEDEGADTAEPDEAEGGQEDDSEKLSPEDQPDLLPGDPEPPKAEHIAEADYNELRAFAASYEDIPGSGIKADKLRKMLMSLRNRYDSGEFDQDEDDPEVVHEADPDDPKTANVTEDEAEEPADEGGAFGEPEDTDDDWSWD